MFVSVFEDDWKLIESLIDEGVMPGAEESIVLDGKPLSNNSAYMYFNICSCAALLMTHNYGTTENLK